MMDLRQAFNKALTLMACTGLAALSVPVMADDIEIYTNSVGGQQLVPNVLLVVDTSGSMRYIDNRTTTRMDELYVALKQVLGEVGDVNLGMMRFTNPGGSILYPVSHIDTPLPQKKVVSRIKGLNDIAYQSSTTSNSHTTSVKKAALNVNDRTTYSGLRFSEIGLPANAQIIDAYLTLYSRDSSTDYTDFNIQIKGEKRIASTDFSFADVYSRWLNATSASITWEASQWPSGTGSSPSRPVPVITNLKSIVQEMVDQSGWTTDSPLTLLMKVGSMSGTRLFATPESDPYYGSDRNNTIAPKLSVTYQSDGMTVRHELLNQLEGMTVRGSTPIADSMLEGYRYFNGENVKDGLNRGPTNSSNANINRLSHSESIVGSPTASRSSKCQAETPDSIFCDTESYSAPKVYKSPITEQCQQNVMVLFSDGSPTGSYDDDTINAFDGGDCSNGKECAYELARVMVQEPGVGNKSTDASQITTFTVGYDSSGFDSTYLENLATAGGGDFYSGGNASELASAFTTIFKKINESNNSFVSPGVAVNQFNRLSHKNDLYYSLFRPLNNVKWPGNLKKYKLVGSQVTDVHGAAAVNPANGFFNESAQSYWSPEVDGKIVAKGGAAANLPSSAHRKVVVNFSDSGSTTDVTTETNSLLVTPSLLDVDENNTDLVSALRSWVAGIDVSDIDGDGNLAETRYEMGDTLHSEPAIVSYNESDINATTADLTIFVATNQGYLHAFKMEGEDQITESFAFIPKDLLKNAQHFYENAFSEDHVYGLDGDVVIDQDDTNINLYLGMRRGGRNYYALDVSEANRNQPRMKFVIRGGQGDFVRLGQSWSKPTVANVQIGSGSRTRVLIFGGGYDPGQDNKTGHGADAMGNAVYMVNADTGELVWHASNSQSTDTGAFTLVEQMQYSIPANISVIDRDYDGLADHLYVADTGGQVFRIDLLNGESANDFAKGGRLAHLGGSDSNNRRFYYAPDIAEVSFGNDHFYALALGSGYRAHPLDTDVGDRFYVLKDNGVFGVEPGTQFDDRSHSTLFNATAHQLRETDGTFKVDLVNSSGWYLDLAAGEKILSRAIIVNHRVAVTSYNPASNQSSEACAPKEGGGRLYLMDLVSSESVVDINNDEELVAEERWADLVKGGIPPQPKVIFPKTGKPVICIGTTCTEAYREDSDNQACQGSKFGCLSEGLFYTKDRVIKNRWNTTTEVDTVE